MVLSGYLVCHVLLICLIVVPKNVKVKGSFIILLPNRSGLGPSPGWGPVRVGARSGLGPGPGWGPYGPIWALMLVFKSVALRVQTAPFDKIRIEFRRSRRRLLIPDLLKAKKQRREIMIF